MRGLEADVHARLDARLNPASRTPLAVALSGGSDSLALTLMAADWARAHDRPLLVLTVDHQLRSESAAWTQGCARHAARLGALFRALAWTGDKPATGLPAAARAARHALLADAAREAGARVILMGHTADDLAESAAMRAAGATVPDAREWSPSPAWPQGRGVFLLRPLLGARRTALRAWLADRGETWIEDPANTDLRFARARARAAGPAGASPGEAPPDLRALAEGVSEDAAGSLSLPRQALRDARPQAAGAFIAMAALCAAGTTSPPRRERLARLAEQLAGGDEVTATLAGARIETDGAWIRWSREAGEFRRNGAPCLRLAPGQSGVWDGRFEITAPAELEVVALAGRASALAQPDQRALRRLPASTRAALPAFEAGGGLVCPVLSPLDRVAIRSLTGERLRAACGLVEREP